MSRSQIANTAVDYAHGVFDDGAEGVAVIGIAWQRLGVEHELAARRPYRPGAAGLFDAHRQC